MTSSDLIDYGFVDALASDKVCRAQTHNAVSHD